MPVDFIAMEDKMNKKTTKKPKAPIVPVTEDTDAPQIAISPLFARKVDRGVTIMTQEASSLSDATKPKRVPKGPSKNITSFKKK